MAWRWVVVVACLSGASWAMGQEEPKPDQLKKMYNDVLAQLKSAQESRNELASEKERLAAQVAQLQEQLQQAQARAAELQKQADEAAEKTYHLRARLAALEAFLERYPTLRVRWKAFLEQDLLSVPAEPPAWVDPNWPLSAEG
jgi:predicted nuclease with TOPRIM domain